MRGAKSSHGRSHRFDPCHAHEGKAPAQGTYSEASYGCPVRVSAGRVPSLFRYREEQHVQAGFMVAQDDMYVPLGLIGQ
jgi:hypothetical protein